MGKASLPLIRLLSACSITHPEDVPLTPSMTSGAENSYAWLNPPSQLDRASLAPVDQRRENPLINKLVPMCEEDPITMCGDETRTPHTTRTAREAHHHTRDTKRGSIDYGLARLDSMLAEACSMLPMTPQHTRSSVGTVLRI